MYDGPMAGGPVVKAVSDVRVLFPEAGVIRVESERVFSALDGALCRRFLQAALQLPAIEDATFATARTPSVDLRYDQSRHRVFAVHPTNQSSRHFEPMRQPSEGSVVVLYRPCLIRETQLELERRSCQSCSEVRRKLMRSMSSRY
jgi:hypothetical protein